MSSKDSNGNSSAVSDPLDEPRALVDALLEERISHVEARRLEALLVQKQDVLRFYVESVHQHFRVAQFAASHNESIVLRDAMLQREPADSSLSDTLYLPALREDPETDVAEPIAGPPVAAAALPRPQTSPNKRRRWIAIAAAVTLLTFGLMFKYRTVPAVVRAPSGFATPVATLSAQVDAHWRDGKPRFAPSSLPAGQLELTAGGVRITFPGGTEIIVHGPARFQLQSTLSIRLLAGKLTANVNHEAAGRFTVNTPCVSIVDLGTEFGVSVAPSGVTEAHVLKGRVRLESATPGGYAMTLIENHAALIKPGSAHIVEVAAPADQFMHELTQIDLADIVAGGDGTGHAHNAGINVVDGSRQPIPPSRYDLHGDGNFRPVKGLPLIAGVFVPLGGNVPSVLDPAGHSFSGFPRSNGLSWYWLWAGGTGFYQNQTQEHYQPQIIGGHSYANGGHDLLFMHASKGITFDLAAMRSAHPGLNLTRFCAVCQNTAGAAHVATNSRKSDFWLFVDGRLRFKRSPILIDDPPFDIHVDLSSTDHFLTLVTTDGGDGYAGDFVTLGDPRLE